VTLSIFVVLCALSPEEIESAPVESLTLQELHSEAARLDDLPSLAPSTVLLGVGGGVSAGSGLLLYFAILATESARSWDALGWVFVDVVLAAVTVAGVAMGIVGGALLPGRIMMRDRYAERQEKVKQRIAEVEALQPPPPAWAPPPPPPPPPPSVQLPRAPVIFSYAWRF